jgi:hypothetical protein
MLWPSTGYLCPNNALMPTRRSERPQTAAGLAQGRQAVIRRPALRLPRQAAHQLVEHEERRIGEIGLERGRRRHQCGRSPEPGQIAHMLHRYPHTLSGKPVEGDLGNVPLPVALDAEGSDEF